VLGSLARRKRQGQDAHDLPPCDLSGFVAPESPR
jgi:hypothetical protein